jgi:hypothetical protein
MLLKCTSISSRERRASQSQIKTVDRLPHPPFTHHDWPGYSGKKHTCMDHIGTEMLILD